MIPVIAIAGALSDAISLANALAPLVQRQAQGDEVTQADVDLVLAQVDQELARFDAAIKRKST